MQLLLAIRIRIRLEQVVLLSVLRLLGNSAHSRFVVRISTIMTPIEAAVTESIFAIRPIHSIAVESHSGIVSRGPIRLVEVTLIGNSKPFSGIWTDRFPVREFQIRKLFQNQICTKSETRTSLDTVLLYTLT
jgi:hypothetical protein